MFFNNGAKTKHSYVDHCQIKAGPAGKVICKDRFQSPVTIVGTQGKGRIVYTGEIFGVNQKSNSVEPEWDEWLRLFKLIHWASGDDMKS